MDVPLASRYKELSSALLCPVRLRENTEIIEWWNEGLRAMKGILKWFLAQGFALCPLLLP
jgi:hypothetical protein